MRKRKLDSIDYQNFFTTRIYPTLQKYYNYSSEPNMAAFCDSVFVAYYDYHYNNKSNYIYLAGNDTIELMNNFCINYLDSLRGWSEYGAYMFYMMYQHLFEYMDNAINKTSKLKMIMFGGHETTVDRFMDFLDGLKIIPRTHYPHYACNIIIELRKYDNIFYLEFYYNDILKLNITYESFRQKINNTKYNNLFNYCGIPENKTLLKEINYRDYYDKLKNNKIFIIKFILCAIIILAFIVILILVKKQKKELKKIPDDKIDNNEKNDNNDKTNISFV